MKKILVVLTLFAVVIFSGCSDPKPEPGPSNLEAWTQPTDGSEPELIEEGP